MVEYSLTLPVSLFSLFQLAISSVLAIIFTGIPLAHYIISALLHVNFHGFGGQQAL